MMIATTTGIAIFIPAVRIKGSQAFRKIVDSQSNGGELTDPHQFGRIVYGLSVELPLKSATMIMTMGER